MYSEDIKGFDFEFAAKLTASEVEGIAMDMLKQVQTEDVKASSSEVMAMLADKMQRSGESFFRIAEGKLEVDDFKVAKAMANKVDPKSNGGLTFHDDGSISFEGKRTQYSEISPKALDKGSFRKLVNQE